MKPSIAVIGVRISWLMFARNSLLDRLADSAALLNFSRVRFAASKASAYSFRSSSAFFWSVISREMVETATTCPETSLTGEIFSDTATREPSLRFRTVLRCSVRTPRFAVSSTSRFSTKRSSGASMDAGWPTTSSSV